MTSTDLDFCRLCFRQDGNVSVFNYECDDAWSLTDRIFECVSVQISQNDKLPHMICRLCLDHVIKWCEFKTYCDRNQRSWFLWLKSLAQGTPQEICEGLAENARRKSLELGFTRNLNSPRKSAFQNYKPLSAAAPKRCRNADVISGEEIEESHNSNSKELRIESTLSLVTDKETILSPFQATQKLTNGYVILDTHNLSERFGKSIDNEQPSSNSKNQSESCIIIESPERTNHSSDEEQHLNIYNNQNKDATVDPKQNYNSGDNLSTTHTDNLALLSNHDQDCEDNFEVESAFDSEDMVTDEPLSEREVALLNGEEPVEEENNLDHVESNAPMLQTSEKEASSEFSMPSLPKRFVSTCPREILKERLMQGVDKRSSPNGLASQPKRPDTPYPHEILKNMGHVLESGSTYKVLPQPTSSPLVSTLDDGRNFNFSTPLSGASEVTPASPPRSLKPVSLSHLMKPQAVSSDRNSESSDSLSFPQVNVQWRVKQEPVSETEDSDDNEGQFSNISIKFEPLDYVEHSQEQPMSSPEIPPSNTTYCDTCSKHFSSHTQLVRHIHSKIHKRVASFVALGNSVDSQTVSQLTKEIRSQAYFRSCAKKQMIAMANEKNISGLQSDASVVASSPLVEIPTSSNTSLRQADNELLECKVCNVVLKSRSYKIKHDNSFSHKCQMEAAANHLESTIDTPNVFPGPSLLHAPTYTCPFASCSSAFSDGGQLIVHMHTHGISLPMHEVNKQIELSKTSIQKKLPTKQMNSDSSVNKFPCRRCDRSFPKALSLSNHLRRCRIVPAKVTVGPSIPCPVCLVMQKNSRTLSYHMKTYHSQSVEQNVVESDPPPPKREFVCTICFKSFTTRIYLRSHNYKVHAQKPVSCKFCKKVYNSKDNLHVHYRSAHLKIKEGEYACYVCFKVFQSYSECCKHRKAGCSLKLKLFSCTECGHSFRSQFSLDKHKEEHTSTSVVESKEPPPPPLDLSFLEDIQNCVCSICNRIYSSYYNLRRHVKTSHIPETNGCSLDDLIKASASGLNISSASGIKEESLQEASTSVTNDTPVIRRTRNHNCERNFGCLYCESKFSTNSNRLSHMKSACKCVPPKVACLNCKVERWPWVTGPCKNCRQDINTKKRPATSRAENVPKRFRSSGPEQIDSFSQELVDSQFSAPELVNESAKPAKIFNNRVFRCSVGKRTFLSHKSMLYHSTNCDGSCKDQGVYCKVCHQVFANPKVYIRHKPCGGKKPIQKPVLGKKRSRINMNDPLRVIPCKFCDYKFRTKKNVSNHMRTVHNYYASAFRKKKPLYQTPVASEEDSIVNVSGKEEIPLQEFYEGEPVSSTSHDVADNTTPNPNRSACPACSKPFSTHQAVVQHVRTAHKNKFSVLECAFCSKSILKRQLYEHGFTCIKDQLANINTLECVVCSTIFYSGDEEDTLSLKLQEHIMNCCGKLTLAKGEKFKNKEKFLCLKCCMLFSSKKSLYAHSFERHGILVQTSPTSQQKNNPINTDKEVLDVTQSDSVMQETDSVLELASATSDSNLTVSTTEDTHPFKCHRCCKRFKTAKGLLSHKSSAHMYQSRKKKKPPLHLKCKFCQRQFYSEVKLRNHEKVHGIVNEVVRTEVEEIHEVPASPDVEIVSEA